MTAKVVLITGAGSGMGHLAARRALAAGWKVAALDVDDRGLDALGEHPGCSSAGPTSPTLPQYRRRSRNATRNWGQSTGWSTLQPSCRWGC